MANPPYNQQKHNQQRPHNPVNNKPYTPPAVAAGTMATPASDFVAEQEALHPREEVVAKVQAGEVTAEQGEDMLHKNATKFESKERVVVYDDLVEHQTFTTLVANEIMCIAIGTTTQRAALDAIRTWLTDNPSYTLDEGNAVMTRMQGAVASIAQEFPRLMANR